jgi:hypothetical protein
MLIACNDRSALERQAEAATTQRLVGTWDARFHLERPLVVGSDSESMKQDVSGQLAFLANRSVNRAYPTMQSPSAYGTFDVDFTPFGFDARSDDETPRAVAGWLTPDSLEMIIGDPESDVTVRMHGSLTGDSIVGGWRVLVARTGGGGGSFVMVRHK